jgi:hypothetical protein
LKSQRSVLGPDHRQLGLFGELSLEHECGAKQFHAAAPQPIHLPAAHEQEGNRASLTPVPEMRVVSERDLPLYTADVTEGVDRSIAGLPEDRLWFTYREIQKLFGVSRATVARRMREGLVPGIRFFGDRVSENGCVRRFDRLQLRYLLLAVVSKRPDSGPE